jgi:hypothetical protein
MKKSLTFSKIGLSILAFMPAWVMAAPTAPSVVPLPMSGTSDLRVVAMNILWYAVSFVGIIALAFLVWGGVQFVTAGGDDGKVTKARTTIINAIIGIIIVLISMGIINWITNAIKDTIK